MATALAPAGRRFNAGTIAAQTIKYLVIVAGAFVMVFPFYWMTITSFKPNEELLSRSSNPFWIVAPTIAHFKKLLFETAYPEWLWNTVLISVSATTISSTPRRCASRGSVSSCARIWCAGTLGSRSFGPAR